MKLVKDLICPSCGAPINVMLAKGNKITCEYCRTVYTLEDETPENTSHQTPDQTSEHVSEAAPVKTTAAPFPKGLAIAAVVFLALYALTHVGIVGFLFLIFLIMTIVKSSSAGGRGSYAERARRYERNGVRVSPKNKWIAFLLCIFFGIFGVHFFYAGRIGRGIVCLVTMDFFGIGYIIDLIVILCGRFRDFSGAIMI